MITPWTSIPKQTFLTENGQIGDCWRCCIAAILGVKAENVPHFLLKKDGTVNSAVDADTQKWLRNFGMYITCSKDFEFHRWNTTIIEVPLIVCGPTQRSKTLGQHHAVVMINDKMVYDPHPSEAGLTAITERYLIFRKP